MFVTVVMFTSYFYDSSHWQYRRCQDMVKCGARADEYMSSGFDRTYAQGVGKTKTGLIFPRSLPLPPPPPPNSNFMGILLCVRLIQEFKAGLLPLTDGTTLRTFLSIMLNCDPMRISKKFVGSNCIGKQAS